METTKQVGIWIRVSTDFQVRDESPEVHEQRARYYAQSKGWEVVEIYRLDAVSGKTVMNHPEAKRMLKDIARGHITGLVFSKLARLARSTKELLEFADIFRKEGADLISLAEQIDTSSPAGRLFFTMISAIAQWEREEISSRVAASIPIRARMGKTTGGAATFGYKWEDGRLQIDETEAPIRRLMYELFLQNQRRKTTAQELNALGYRTRNGSPFSDNTVDRLLRDPTAKGERRANYSKSMGNNKHWILKPESEWVIVPCPAIISEETYNKVNAIISLQEQKLKRTGKRALYLLSGFVKCECGKNMYVAQRIQAYRCQPCKRRLNVADIDEIYEAYLTDYLQSFNQTAFLASSNTLITEKQALLTHTTSERKKLSKKFETYLEMRTNEELSKEQFMEYCKPLHDRIAQLDETIPELLAEVDFLSIQMASTDTVLNEANNLSAQWAHMPMEEKRAIVETITDSIVIKNEDIDIALCFLPSSSEMGIISDTSMYVWFL